MCRTPTAFCRQKPKTVSAMSAVRIRAPNACRPEPVVATRQKPLAHVPDPLQAEHAVCDCVLLIVDVAEHLQMPVKDRVQLIATPAGCSEPWWQSRAIEWRFPHTTRRSNSPPFFTLPPRRNITLGFEQNSNYTAPADSTHPCNVIVWLSRAPRQPGTNLLNPVAISTRLPPWSQTPLPR